jgi:nucleotide-binding universal stress UspA family protein
MAERSSSGHHVVVGTDFSPASQEAVARAIRIAKDNDATLHVVHGAGRIPAALARRFGLNERRVDTELETVAKHARAERVRATAHHVETGPNKALRSVARDVGATLIVVGTRGRTVPDTFVGSTAERIAAISSVPVLLVRGSARAAYRDVVIAADRSSKVDIVARAARFVAPDTELSVLHAYEGLFETTLRLHGANERDIADHRARARKEAREALRPLMDRAGLEPSMLVLRHGDPRRLLHRMPKRTLLVMQRGSVIAHAFLGSVTRSVVAHGQSDVLIT